MILYVTFTSSDHFCFLVQCEKGVSAPISYTYRCFFVLDPPPTTNVSAGKAKRRRARWCPALTNGKQGNVAPQLAFPSGLCHLRG